MNDRIKVRMDEFVIFVSFIRNSFQKNKTQGK